MVYNRSHEQVSLRRTTFIRLNIDGLLGHPHDRLLSGKRRLFMHWREGVLVSAQLVWVISFPLTIIFSDVYGPHFDSLVTRYVGRRKLNLEVLLIVGELTKHVLLQLLLVGHRHHVLVGRQSNLRFRCRVVILLTVWLRHAFTRLLNLHKFCLRVQRSSLAILRALREMGISV